MEGNFAEGTINGEGEYVFADGSRLGIGGYRLQKVAYWVFIIGGNLRGRGG